MAAPFRSAFDPSDSARTDREYLIDVGLDIATFGGPLSVLALSRIVIDAALLYTGFIAAVAAATALAALIASRVPGLAVTLGRRDSIWILAVLPFSWFVSAFGAIAMGVVLPTIVFPLAVIGTTGGMHLGIILVAMSRTRHANVALHHVVELAEWEAR